MARGATRPARAREICAAVPSGSAIIWAGQVKTLSSNNEGRGVLAVSVSDDITLQTWNNALSDIGDKTLIDPHSSLFAKASKLSVGQFIVFSGAFIRDPSDCFRETSMTVQGGMTAPEFIFRFVAIRAVED
jgi:hypothetical protein